LFIKHDVATAQLRDGLWIYIDQGWLLGKSLTTR